MKKIQKFLSILCVITMLFTSSFSAIGAAAANITVMAYSDTAIEDAIDDGVIVGDDVSYCGCCHNHEHKDNFGGKISCFFCKIISAIKRLFGKGETGVVHKYQIKSQTTATCKNEGSYSLKCAQCGATKTVKTPVLSHKEKDVPATQPTCTKTGLTAGKVCEVCGEILVAQQAVAAFGHNEEILPAVAATCTSTGISEGKRCTVCGEVTVAQNIVPALGHAEETLAAVEPTCTETGLTEGKRCSRCGEVITAQTTVAAKGHTEVTLTAVDPTCTETGLTEGKKCSVCGEILTAQTTVEALGHTEETLAAVEPTCTETGLTEGKKCSVCGEILVAQTVVPAKGHTEETLTAVAPTCVATGLTEGKKCSVCGEILTAQDTVSALGHTEVIDEAVAPTCTETGLTEGKHCSVCEAVLTAQEEVAALGHTEVTLTAVAPTCTETGLTEGKKCSVCEAVLVAQTVIPAKGHSEETLEAVAPTCTATGLTEGKKCSVCGEILTAQTIVPAKGHTEEVLNAVAPTCTVTGLSEGKKCSVCGEILVPQNTLPALGHNEVMLNPMPATCTTNGLSSGIKCSVCEEILVEQMPIAAMGHYLTEVEYLAPTATEAGHNAGVVCNRCDYADGAEVIPSMSEGLVKLNSKPITFNFNPVDMVYDDYELDNPFAYCPEASTDGDYAVKATCNYDECLCSALSFTVEGEGYLTFDVLFGNDAYMYGDYLQITDYDWDIAEWLSPGDYAGKWATVGFDFGLSEGEKKEILLEYWSGSVADGKYDDYFMYMKNFCYSNEDQTVNIDVIGNGSVGGSFGDEDISGSGEYISAIGSQLTITATPDAGNIFFGWYDENGKYITSDATIDKVIADNCTYVALFGTKDHFALVGQTFYEDIDSALAAASSGDTVRVLAKNITIDHDITIPAGVTLVLPCRDADYGVEADGYCPDGTVTTPNNDVSSLYSTTTITEGTTVTVNGTLLVNAVTGRKASGGATIYNITGGYALVHNAGEIVVANGGTLDCNGTIDGEGLVYASSGAKVYENYAIQRWRGGSAAYGSISANVYPIIESEMNSVKCTLRVDSGASLIGNVKVYASGAYQKTRFPQIDNTNGLYRLNDGAYVIRTVEWDDTTSTKYNNSTTQGGYRDIYKFYGGMTMAQSSLKLVGIDVGTDINPLSSQTLWFGVDGDMSFELYDGNYTVDKTFKFLPGFVMKLGDNVTLDITSTGGVAMLSDTYTTTDAGFNQTISTYPTLRGDAQLILSDTAVINYSGILAGKVAGGTVNRVGSGQNHAEIPVMKDNNATVKYTEALKKS